MRSETVSAKGSSLIYIGSAAGVTGVILALSVIAAAVWLTYKKHGRSGQSQAPAPLQ